MLRDHRTPTRHRPDIQGLRAVAVLLVLAFHSGLPVPGGFSGVDVFFVISGFVIAQMLLRELDTTGRLDLRRFYLRRARRLLPALTLVLAATLTLGVYFTPTATQQLEAETAVTATFFVANFYLYGAPDGYFDPAATANPLLHLWTLSVEEQFYLVFPALLLLAWGIGRRRAAVSVLAVVCVAGFVLSLALTRGHSIFGIDDPGQFAFYSSPTRAWEFAVGALLALTAHRLTRLRFRTVLQITGAALLIVSAALLRESEFPGHQALLPVLGTAALIAAGSDNLLSSRPAVWIGDLSYSLYLWHWPLIVFATTQWPGIGWVPPLAALTAFLPAWLSYRYVENPVRFSPRLRGRALAIVVAVCLLVPVAGASAMLRVNETISESPPLEQWTLSQRPHADAVRGCDDPTPVGGPRKPACAWRVTKPLGTVVLLGDSNAGHFTEPVTRAANRLRFNAVVAAVSGCPFANVLVDGSSLNPGTCRDFIVGTMRELVRIRPVLVVIAARTDGLIEEPGVGLADPVARVFTRDPAEKARLWKAGLSTVVRQLGAAGIPTLVVHPVPLIPSLPTHCSTASVMSGSCSGTVTRDDAKARRWRSVQAERAAVSSSRRSSAIDFINRLCTRTACSSTRPDGIRMYRNSDHLSVQGALTLTGAFQQAISTRARK